MGISPTPAPRAQYEGAIADASRVLRHWSIDDIFVALFALLGIVGGTFLPLFQPIPPITTSFLLATGLAALTYRFLGGIQGSAFGIGALKLTGTLGALVGIAMLINHAMITERNQVYHVTGNVVDVTGKHVILDVDHFIVSPPPIYSDSKDNDFSITFTTGIDTAGQPSFPNLYICSGSLSTSIDLGNAKHNGLEIPLGIVTLNQPESSSSAQASCAN